MATVEFRYIVCTPDVMDGEPRIDGHRIRVRDVVAMRDFRGYTPEEIAATAYPQLSLAQVYAALAYYEDHRAEIQKLAEREAAFVKQFQREHADSAVVLRLPAQE